MPKLTIVMLAQGSGETSLADDALSSIPNEWKRLLLVEHLDPAWSELVARHKLQIKIIPFLNYATAKNSGLDLVKTDWVFFLDTDESLTSELADEIRFTIKEADFNGYYVPRANKVLGVVVRNSGWYPDYQLRLFRPSFGRYVGDVHEQIKITEPVGYLKNDLQHNSIRSLSQWHTKIDRYTDFEADILARSNIRPTGFLMTRRTLGEFFTRYVRLKGYRDGIRGFLIAVMSSYYCFLAYAKLWEYPSLRMMNSLLRFFCVNSFNV